MKIVSSLIEKLDKKTNVVLIEAIIVLAKDNFAEALGARLGLQKMQIFLYQVWEEHLLAVHAGEAALTTVEIDCNSDRSRRCSRFNFEYFAFISKLWYRFISGIGDMTRLKLEIAALESETLSRTLSNQGIFTMDNELAKNFSG